MCQQAISQEANPPHAMDQRSRRDTHCNGTGVYIPASLLKSSVSSSPMMTQGTSRRIRSTPSSSQHSTQRQDSMNNSMQSIQSIASARACCPGGSPTSRNRCTTGTSVPGRSYTTSSICSEHSAPIPCHQVPEQLTGMTSQQGFCISTSAHAIARYADYEAWMASAQRQMQYTAPRRHASIDLPALYEQPCRPRTSSVRRHSYHNGHYVAAAHHERCSPCSQQTAPEYEDASAAPYRQCRCSGCYGPANTSSSSSRAAHPALMQQQSYGAAVSALGSSCSVSAPMPALPADYGADEVLLDEHIQAMLLDVLQLSDQVASGVARSNSGNSAQMVSLQQQQMQAEDSLAGYDTTCAPLACVSSEMLTTATAGPLLAPSCDAAAYAGMTSPPSGSPLTSYMNRHEQQKLRHQQCISAATSASFYGPGHCDNGRHHPLSAAGLNERAQAKLQELMIAQQLQLEIQSELLQLLAAS